MNGDIDLESLYYDYVIVDVKDGDIPSTYTNSLGQTFSLIPAGTFTMGSPRTNREGTVMRRSTR